MRLFRTTLYILLVMLPTIHDALIPDCKFVMDIFFFSVTPPSVSPTAAPTDHPTNAPTTSPTTVFINASAIDPNEEDLDDRGSPGSSSAGVSMMALMFVMRPTILDTCYASSFGDEHPAISYYHACDADNQLIRYIWWENTDCDANEPFEQWTIAESANHTQFNCVAAFDCDTADIVTVPALTASPTGSPTQSPTSAPTVPPTFTDEMFNTTDELDSDSENPADLNDDEGGGSSFASMFECADGILGPLPNPSEEQSSQTTTTTTYAVGMCFNISDFGALFEDDDDDDDDDTTTTTTTTTEMPLSYNTTDMADDEEEDINDGGGSISDPTAESGGAIVLSWGFFCDFETHAYSFGVYDNDHCEVSNDSLVLQYRNDSCWAFPPAWVYTECHRNNGSSTPDDSSPPQTTLENGTTATDNTEQPQGSSGAFSTRFASWYKVGVVLYCIVSAASVVLHC